MNKSQAGQVIDRIDEYIDTARRVKGDRFAGFVLHLVDLHQLIQVMRLLSDFCVEKGGEDRVQAARFITQAIMSQSSIRLADILNLSSDDCSEATTLADQIVSSIRKTP